MQIAWGRIRRSLLALASLIGMASGQIGAARAQDPSPDSSVAPEPRRVVLSGLPTDLMPQASNVWECDCDTDGCWPGCFPIAAATLLKYWSAYGYPALWQGYENDILRELRTTFPGLFCYNNHDDDGKPGEAGYDVFGVAKGLEQYVRARGYAPVIQTIVEPTFEQIVAEIDAGRPVIGSFGASPWGAHAVTIIGYDTTAGRRTMIVRPNLWNKPDTDLVWGVGYSEFAIITFGIHNDTDTLAPPPARDFELVLDDNDDSFSTSGAWLFDTGVGFAGKAHYALTAPAEASEDTATARWEVLLPYDGLWEVYAWLPGRLPDFSVCEGVSRVACEHAPAQVATYRVTHAEGMSFAYRSQSKGNGWALLGTFPFVRGARAAVEIGNATGDDPARFVWADAVRFVWRAPLLVRNEAGGPVFFVNQGIRRAVLDPQTFEALRLSVLEVRAVPEFTLERYPQADVLPSVMGSWVGVFYNNPLLSPPVSVITHSTRLDFRWDGVPPAEGVAAFGFSTRWSRYLATTEGEYPLAVEAIGGVRVWVNGKLEIAAWDAPSDVLIRHEKVISLTAGLHRIDVEYVARGASAQLRFGNLPPNTPVIPEDSAPVWTSALTSTLRWQDTGDPDRFGKSDQLRFFVTLWHEHGWQATSGWLTTTEWTTALPLEGTYRWNVIASDGYANSKPSEPHTLIADRTPPWSQMLGATPITDTSQITSELPQGMLEQALTAPAAYLIWWGSDAPHTTTAHLTYDLQARELQRAHTVYTLTTEPVIVTRTGYALVISGSAEITVPVVITDTLIYTTVAPITVIETITSLEWITFATGLRHTQTIFIGQPGSVYEIRVRAVDTAGNAQRWYEGYAVQVALEPRRPQQRSERVRRR